MTAFPYWNTTVSIAILNSLNIRTGNMPPAYCNLIFYGNLMKPAASYNSKRTHIKFTSLSAGKFEKFPVQICKIIHVAHLSITRLTIPGAYLLIDLKNSYIWLMLCSNLISWFLQAFFAQVKNSSLKFVIFRTQYKFYSINFKLFLVVQKYYKSLNVNYGNLDGWHLVENIEVFLQ